VPPRVVITGLGVVSALGRDVASLTAGLRDGRCAIAPLTLFAYSGRASTAAQVAELPAVLPPALARRLSRPDRFALAAATEACDAAGLDAALRRRAALYVGATTGGMLETEAAYRRRRAGEDSRFRLSRVVATPLATACAVVSQTLGLHGPQVVVAVNVQEPKTNDYFGMSVAGPVFYSVMNAALQTLQIQPQPGLVAPYVRLNAR